MASIPLPALDVHPAQSPDALSQYSTALQMKSLLGEQQMQSIQIQQAQQQQKDQQAVTQAWKNWDGKDTDGLVKGVLDAGGSGAAANQVEQTLMARQQQKNALSESDLKLQNEKTDRMLGRLDAAENVRDEDLPLHVQNALQESVKAGDLDPQHAAAAQQLLAKAGPDPKAMRDTLDNFKKGFQLDSVQNARAKDQADIQKNQAQAAAENAKAALDQLKLKGASMSPGDVHAAVSSVVPSNWSDPTLAQRTESRMNFARSQGDLEGVQKALTDASAEIGAVKKETNPQVQANKIAVATAEAKAKQLIEGMAIPGYAFNPKTGQTELTDETKYLQSGGQLQAFRKVGEKDVRDDTMLTNRLADVHQKIAEYEKALQQPISAKDQGNIAALLGTDKLKASMHPSGILGGIGLEIPMDRVNAVLDKENMQGLSANARDQLIAYKNAREAMMGYKTVLSGSAKGSDKSMDLLTQALPDPSITDPDYSTRSLNAFKGNLHVVGQGLPTLPGIKNPTQIEEEVWGKQNQPTTNTKQAGPPAGATHIVKGKDNKDHYTNATGTVDYGVVAQ